MNPKTNNETAPPSIVTELTAEQLQQQEAGYVYRYRYNGGAATQVWLSHGRFKLFYKSLDCYQMHTSFYPAFRSFLCGLSLCNNHQLSSMIWNITSNSSSFWSWIFCSPARVLKIWFSPTPCNVLQITSFNNLFIGLQCTGMQWLIYQQDLVHMEDWKLKKEV